MELLICGPEAKPSLLMLPARGMSAAALLEPLKGLEDSYRVICADGAGSVEELEALLLERGLSRISGAYGLREGATLLLALLAQGKVSVRKAVTEGPFSLPKAGLTPELTDFVCWRGGKDKKAKKALDALRKACPGAASHVLGKLKSGQDFVSVRPDLMLARLKTTFGAAAVVTVSSRLPQDTRKVWAALGREDVSCPLIPETEVVSARPEDLTLLREGRSKSIPLWSHQTQLRSVAGEATECIDRVEIDAGKLRPLAVPLAKLCLARERRSRRKAL